MLNVIHFDYEPNLDRNCRSIVETALQDLDNVNYQFMGSTKKTPITFDQRKEQLEKLLPETHLLLIHPGLENQRTVLQDYPKRFPNLKVAIVSNDEFDYRRLTYGRTAPRVAFLSCRSENLATLVEYVNKAKNDLSSGNWNK
jgi:hypothetical protein